MWWYNRTRKTDLDTSLIFTILSLRDVARLTKLFQFGEETEAQEKSVLSVNHSSTANVSGAVKPRDGRRWNEHLVKCEAGKRKTEKWVRTECG